MILFQYAQHIYFYKTKSLLMKSVISPLLFALVVLLFVPSGAHSAVEDSSARTRIMAFLQAVYRSDSAPADIAKQYIALSTSANEFSTEKRYEIASYHIQLLREGNSMATPGASRPTLDRVTVVPYRKLSKEQVIDFELDTKQLQHIYAALENGTVIRYFVYENDKVSSFDYLTKGKEGPRYFIGY